jgi:DNA replication protein DnaC
MEPERLDLTDDPALDLELEAHLSLARQAAAQRSSDGMLRPIALTDLRAMPITSTMTTPATLSPRRPSPCDACGGIGWYKEAVPLGHPSFGKLLPCACKLAEQQERQQDLAAQHLAQLASELGELADKTFERFNPEWDTEARHRTSLRTARREVEAITRKGEHWLFLTGPTGTGKSHLAAAAALSLAAQGRTTYYRSVPAMIDALRAGYRTGDFDERLAAICNVAVLVLDDLGAEQASDGNRALLFSIINHRALRPELITIITSNAGLDPMRNEPFPHIEPRIASRIKMRAVIIPMVANDYRVLLGNQRNPRRSA